MNNFFKIFNVDELSRAGEITINGIKIQTPCFMPVATQASVKSLDSLENKEEVYTKLYNSYIFPAANAYRNRQKHDTFNLYKKGIQFAFKCIDSKSLI